MLDGIEIERLEAGRAHLRILANIDSMIERERATIEKLLSRAAGRALTIVIPEASTPVENAPAASSGPSPAEHPLVQEAARLFDAKVVSISRRRAAPPA